MNIVSHNLFSVILYEYFTHRKIDEASIVLLIRIHETSFRQSFHEYDRTIIEIRSDAEESKSSEN